MELEQPVRAGLLDGGDMTRDEFEAAMANLGGRR
jgi:hypothetical protein